MAAEPFETIECYGRIVPVGTVDHWQLMSQACRAKFPQHAEARSALQCTGDRPVVHKVHRDCRTIPGVIMAQIWMNVGRGLGKGSAPGRNEPTED